MTGFEQINPPCAAMLMIAGVDYPCDWPTTPGGDHPGWAHTNQEAQAQWTEDRYLPNEEQGMKRIVSGQGATDLGTATGEGLGGPEPAAEPVPEVRQGDGGVILGEIADEAYSLDKHLSEPEPVIEPSVDYHTQVPDVPQEPAGKPVDPTWGAVTAVVRKGATDEYDVDRILHWVLTKLGEEFTPKGVADAAAFLAGGHVEPGFAV